MKLPSFRVDQVHAEAHDNCPGARNQHMLQLRPALTRTGTRCSDSSEWSGPADTLKRHNYQVRAWSVAGELVRLRFPLGKPESYTWELAVVGIFHFERRVEPWEYHFGTSGVGSADRILAWWTCE
jgi:hypothetical protein